MSDKQYDEFYAEVQCVCLDKFNAWMLRKKLSVVKTEACTIALNKFIIHTPEPVYLSNLKKSLSTALQVPLSETTLRTPTCTDFEVQVASPSDSIDSLSMAELRAQLRDARAQLSVTNQLQTQIQQLTELVQKTHLVPTTTNNINITINNFGSEDLSYLSTPAFYRGLRDDGVVLAIKQIHFNDEYPANRTVRIKSLKHQLAEVHMNGDWQIKSLRKTEDMMISNANAYIARGLNPSTVDDDTLQWMRNSYMKDSKSRVREDVKSMLCNDRVNA